MLRKRPGIGKLAGALRVGIMDPTTSPNSPLGFIKSSSKPNKNSSTSYDIGGIGLGIVAALDKSNNKNNTNNGDHQCNVLARYAFYGQSSAQTGPTRAEDGEKSDILGGLGEGSSIIISNVTYHGTCSKSIMASRVCHKASEFGNSRERVVVSKISPARLTGDRHFSGPDFLSSCCLCEKALHGKDIYMYGGEKAFCSTECRQRQIRMDERKERFKSSEPCSYTTTTTKGEIEIFFSTGVVAV